MKTFIILIISIMAIKSNVYAEMNVQVIKLNGKVMVRYGLEEKWRPAAIGMILRDIDTILSGENGEVTLKMADKSFILGSNAILDIADLREIQENELFLYLMSKKIDKIENRNSKTPIRVGNVSVVHGSKSEASTDSTSVDSTKTSWYLHEKNGALALLLQKYYTNSIIKLYRIIEKYESMVNMGEIYFYVGKGFEALNKNGQSIDAYEKALDYYKINDDKISLQKMDEIKENIKILKNKDGE